MLRKIIFIFTLCIISSFAKADELTIDTTKHDSIIVHSSELYFHYEPASVTNWKLRFVDFLKRKTGENNKTVAAILAFPLFGIIGLHRIYLGTKPYVPVVYIATLGGCAGVLPLIDFFAILFANKETFDRYKENPKVFMWIK